VWSWRWSSRVNQAWAFQFGYIKALMQAAEDEARRSQE
jgi:hypothetical protein